MALATSTGTLARSITCPPGILGSPMLGVLWGQLRQSPKADLAAREGVWGAVSPCLFRLQRPRSHGGVDQPAASCSPSVLPVQGGGVLTSDQIDSAAAGAWAA